MRIIVTKGRIRNHEDTLTVTLVAENEREQRGIGRVNLEALSWRLESFRENVTLWIAGRSLNHLAEEEEE